MKMDTRTANGRTDCGRKNGGRPDGGHMDSGRKNGGRTDCGSKGGGRAGARRTHQAGRWMEGARQDGHGGRADGGRKGVEGFINRRWLQT